MKFLKDFLIEELTKKQKQKVDAMDSMDYKIKNQHDLVFGKENDRIIVPMPDTDEKITSDNYSSYGGSNSITHHIIRRLDLLGYKTDDYLSGLAYHRDTPERKLKINKIFEKHEIHNEPTRFTNKKGTNLSLSQAYAADPMRSSKGNEKQIVISRNRYDVAGMSTGRGWTSCMNLVNGCNKHYVKHDLRHGTLTAYLTNKGDDDIQNPSARLNIKQFTSYNEPPTFIPERGVYGSAPETFRTTVKDWVDKNYPKKPGIYAKKAELYNDDGNSIHVEQPEKLLSEHTKETYDNLHGAARDILHATANEQNHLNNKFGEFQEQEEDAKNSIINAVDNIANKFPKSMQADLAIHGIKSRAENDEDTDNNHYNSFENMSLDELRGENIMHEWAKDKISGNRDVNEHIANSMSLDDAFKHHKDIHNIVDNMDESNVSEDNHESLKDVHSSIINKILNSDNQKYKDEVVNDMSAPKDSHRAYYNDITEGYLTKGTYNPINHPLTYTDNPRVIHNWTRNTPHDIDEKYNDFENGDVAHHIGEHADVDLVQHLMSNSDHNIFDDDRHIDKFVKGSNHNPNGEDIHHEMTSGILFSGGQHFGGHYGLTTRIPALSNVKLSTGDATDDLYERSIFSSVARHSKFKSVLDKLKDRPDTQDLLKDELSKNKHLNGTANTSYTDFMRRL